MVHLCQFSHRGAIHGTDDVHSVQRRGYSTGTTCCATDRPSQSVNDVGSWNECTLSCLGTSKCSGVNWKEPGTCEMFFFRPEYYSILRNCYHFRGSTREFNYSCSKVTLRTCYMNQELLKTDRPLSLANFTHFLEKKMLFFSLTHLETLAHQISMKPTCYMNMLDPFTLEAMVSFHNLFLFYLFY